MWERMREVAHGSPARARRSAAHSKLPDPVAPLAAFRRYNRAYFQRWLLLGSLIGVVAGLGAIAFAWAIATASHLFLGLGAGFAPPNPAGEGTAVITPIARRWMIPVITTLGGVLTGLIVFTFAPEAEGHGTDSAIQAFHEKNGQIRPRIPLIKLVASAITIGSGGSAGREGPTAQISAGFGSLLAGMLRLDDHDRRIAVAAGIGAGIGSIFKAPFGGALLSAEILYKRDFETDALFPSFVASAIGFTIYGAWANWTPVFGAGGRFSFDHPVSLSGYLILGICAGLVGLLYPKILYGVRDLFHRIPVPRHIKPAIGGLLVGLIGLAFPEALGMGYGYVQFGIYGDYVHIAAWLMAALVLIKIITTSLTIGSGGSGGVFGPGMVIGGFLGGALWALLHSVAPALVQGTNAGAFVVVGMGAFFGGIAKAPLAVILMVAEMTGEYSLIAPAMLATMVAYLVTGDTSIYESQVPTRLDSPAHKDDYALPLLQSLTVADAMLTNASGAVATATSDALVKDMSQIFRERRVATILVRNGERLTGIVTPADLARIPADEADRARAKQIMSRVLVWAFPDETLYSAWLRMSRRGLRQLPVVDREDKSRLLGVVTGDAIGRLLAPESGQIPALVAMTKHVTDVDAEEEDGTDASHAIPNAALEEKQPIPAASAHNNDPLAQVRVGDAMLMNPRLVRISDPLEKASAMLTRYGSALMVVDDQDRLVGIVTWSDIQSLRGDERHGTTVGDVAVRNLVMAQPDETLRSVAKRMSRAGLRQLPVVGLGESATPIGLLRRSDVLAAYERALGESAPVRAS